MPLIKFNIIHHLYTVKLLDNPVVTDKAKMYKNGPGSLGPSRQSGPRSAFFKFFVSGVN